MTTLRSITAALRRRRAAERPLARTLRRLAMACASVALGVSSLASEQAPDAQTPPAPIAVPAARHAEKLAVITIHGAIDRWTVYSVNRRMKAAERMGADGIVFDINTPGGELGATLELCNRIKQSPIPNTIAWVNQDAYSAGTFIALACREIIASPYATMGDAAPIAISPFGGVVIPETERQKMLAPLLAEIVDSARRRGYDEKLVQGFIMLDVELWLVENLQTRQRMFIGEQEYRTIFGEEPERTSARHSATPGGRASAPAAARSGSASQSTGGFQPAAPGMDAEAREQIEEALADKSAPSTRPVLTSADRGEWALIEYTTDGSTLLTFKTEDLLRYELAADTIADDSALRTFVGATTLNRLDTTWSEALARFFASLPVQGLLIVIFLLGLFVEMSSPGVGVAGGVALLALMGLLAPQFIAGAAAWWGVVALLLGLSLIALELFVLPGFGVFGVAGIAALFAGLLGIVIGPGGVFPQNAGERLDLIYGVTTVLLALGTTLVGMFLISKHYRALPLLNRLVLTDRPASDEDDDAGAGLLSAMGEAVGTLRVGDVGVAITPLRPAGSAEFGDTLVDVVSGHGFLEQGARVRVIKAGGMRVVVEPVEGDDSGLFADVGPDGGGGSA